MPFRADFFFRSPLAERRPVALEELFAFERFLLGELFGIALVSRDESLFGFCGFGTKRIAMTMEPNFATFWPEYVRAHSQPGTRAVHLAGTLIGWALLVAAMALQRWWWLPLALVVPYALAWISHFFVEHNRPATFQHPYGPGGPTKKWSR